MAIGRHDCKEARNTDLKQAIAIGLDEAMIALEEAFYDLSDEQMQAFVIPGRNNIAWIVMHCLDNLSQYSGGFQTGHRDIPEERRWDLWQAAPHERPKPGDEFPSREKMLALLRQVRSTAEKGLHAAGEQDLHTRRCAEGWWDKTAADAYMRTIFHTMAHVRQVWLLRGALGLTDGKSWPQQHYA